MLPPLVMFTFVYCMLGLLTASILWDDMSERAETMIGFEKQEDQEAIRLVLITLLTVMWPVVLIEISGKR